ncbi:MAG TPA: hypothetical protein VEI98_16460 [Xanthobacteraceae bacterium]|nr:hypothetical protein [Xanthobacteraceae bacterium]
MTSTSTVSQNLRETTKDAREGAREIREAAATASKDIQDDLQALRADFSRLAAQVGDILANRGAAAWQRTSSQIKSSVDGAMSDAQEKGQEAADAMREVSDSLVAAIDDSLKNRPYTTLAIVGGIGFLLGAMWRR